MIEVCIAIYLGIGMNVAACLAFSNQREHPDGVLILRGCACTFLWPVVLLATIAKKKSWAMKQGGTFTPPAPSHRKG